MSITVTESTVDHRYLMNKPKSELATWAQEQERLIGGRTMTPHADLMNLAKDALAATILAGIRELESLELLNHAQAVDEFDTPFGAIFYTEQAPAGRWVFVGWARDGRVREAVFVRELQPGDRRGLERPMIDGFNRSADLILRFPDIVSYRKASL